MRVTLGPTAAVTFRSLTLDDLGCLCEWLGRDHVSRWWGAPPTYEQVVEEYAPAIEGRDPTDSYVIVTDGRDVGFIQTYLVDDYPEHASLVAAGTEAAGLDLFIAEPDLIGRGLGTEAIRSFASSIVFARTETRACIADPDVRNLASIRAFENAGFVRVRDFVDPDDGERHALLRLDR